MTDSNNKNNTAPARKITLHEARVRLARMSVYELWQKSGVFDKTIRSIEAGAKPRMATIRKLSEALGVEPEAIDWPGDPLEMGDSRHAS